MIKNPLALIEENDGDLYKSIVQNRELAFNDEKLSKKTKLLIALAIDASHGAVNGVRSLAGQALANGATKEEIMETLRVVNFICGVGAIYSAANGLDGIL